MSSSNSPCAACKFLRRKCTLECVYAPYFPADQPQKFANVHKVFGASNVAKILSDLNVAQREDAVNSLAYEAEFRLRDPVYGCVGLISVLKHRLDQVQADLVNAKKELATFIGPSALLPMFDHSTVAGYSNAMPPPMHALPPPPLHGGGGGGIVIRDPQLPYPHQHLQQQQQQQQMMDLQQQQMAAIAAAREAELFRRYEQHHQHQHQHQQQNEFLRYNNSGGFDPGAGVSGFNNNIGAAASPSLALGSYDNSSYHHQQHQEHPDHHLHFQSQLVLQQPKHSRAAAGTPQQQQRSGSEDGNKGVGPSC